jgi:DNA-binding PadR family transcriptional regulator
LTYEEEETFVYIDILILAELSARPYHGYELKRQVEWILGETLNSNHLYPALRRYEEMGAIYHEVERQSGRPDRHVYHLTERGKDVLRTLLLDFPPDLARSDSEFQTRVAFFHLLDPAERLAILQTRREVLEQRLQHRQHALALAREHPHAIYVPSILEFQLRQIHQEVEWIATLT